MKTKPILTNYFKAITNVASQGDVREECSGWVADNRIKDYPFAYLLLIPTQHIKENAQCNH